MKIYLKALLATALVAVGFFFLFGYWGKITLSEEGDRRLKLIESMEKQGLPDFSAVSTRGQKIQLSQFQGKPVIVNFWASWCGPCVEEFPSMVKLIEEMKGEVQLIAISQDSSEEEMQSFLKAFPKGENPNIHVIWDHDRSLGTMYSADRLPESFVADREHKLARKIIGSIDWATPEAIEYMRSLLKP